jgi:hypothetical protein
MAPDFKVSEASPRCDHSPSARRRALRVLASGVDSLYASVPGELKNGVIEMLAEHRANADKGGAVMSFRNEDGHFLVRPHGWRGYPFWLSSPRYELFVGAAAPFPPVYVALHSPYIHTLGIEEAVGEIQSQLTGLLCGEVSLVPSRVDLYADTQGWQPTAVDFGRFVCRGVRRQLYEQPRQLHASGRRLSGFMFGKGDVVARIYDKTLEMQVRGSTWQELMWQDRDPADAVWRVEFQFRRRGLTTFGIRSMDEAFRSRQDLWEYGTRWLSLRRPTQHMKMSRWPEAPAWVVLRSAQLGSPRSGLIRERIRLADERRLVSGFLGYVSSLAAMSSGSDVDGAVRRAVPLANRYLDERGTPFSEIVERKRALRRATR